jgi:hypothetical protein
MPKQCAWHGTLSGRNRGPPRRGEKKKCKKLYIIYENFWG